MIKSVLSQKITPECTLQCKILCTLHHLWRFQCNIILARAQLFLCIHTVIQIK